MPYIVKAEKIEGKLPEKIFEGKDIEEAYQAYHAMMMDGYRTMYVVTPDGRRLELISDVWAERNKAKSEAEKRGGSL